MNVLQIRCLFTYFVNLLIVCWHFFLSYLKAQVIQPNCVNMKENATIYTCGLFALYRSIHSSLVSILLVTLRDKNVARYTYIYSHIYIYICVCVCVCVCMCICI